MAAINVNKAFLAACYNEEDEMGEESGDTAVCSFDVNLGALRAGWGSGNLLRVREYSMSK
jgi:hypothetical protein